MPIDKNADSIQVMVRIRPLNFRELAEDAETCVIIDESNPNTIILDAKPDQKLFTFDWVGGERTTQENIFNIVGKTMIEACLEGYNCCIFAYGQTGTGKTYTIQGKGLGQEDQDTVNRGLQPRVFDCIFSSISQEMKKVPQEIEYLVSCSYLEIYNEQVMDLLEPSGLNLQVREDLQKGVYVEGLREEVATNSEEAIELLRQGITNRHVSSTNMNIESSRSHSVFTMKIESKRSVNGLVHLKTSKFHFVDLAGSERQKQTATAGERLKEAGNINKSLLVLGQVINSLVESSEGKQRHIRYRDSKLTFLLRDSLGGNAKTCLIANISPVSSAFSETLSTLKFAQRAKQIKNEAHINEDANGNVENLKKEIKRLRDELLQAQSEIISLNKNQSKISNLSSIAPAPEDQRKEVQNIFYNLNRSSLKLEGLVKRELEMAVQNELLLQVEISKKEDYVNTFKSAVELYEANELQYRSVINLYESRLARRDQLAQMILAEGVEVNQIILEDYEKLVKERQALLEIVKNTPTIMRVFMENIEMRDKVETLEGDANPTSSLSVTNHLEENIFLLKKTITNLDEDIKLKRMLNQKIEQLQGLKLEEETSANDKEAGLTIAQIKLDYNNRIDQLNFKILELEQREVENLRIIEGEKKKNAQLLKEYETLESTKRKIEERHEIKLAELVQSFQEIESKKANVTDAAREISNLHIRNLEFRELAESYKEKYEDVFNVCQEMEEWIKTTLAEKEITEKQYIEQIDKVNMEKGVMINAIASLENNMEALMADLASSKDQISELLGKIDKFHEIEEEYRITIEKLSSINDQLQEKFKEAQGSQSNEVFRLEALLEKERLRVESLENEKVKMQEELDTLALTLNFNVNDLQEKKHLLNEAHNQITFQKNMNNQLELKVQELEGLVMLLKDQIQDQNKEDSPFNTILQENSALKTQIDLMRAEFEKLQICLQNKEIEIQQGNTKILELSQLMDTLTQSCHELSAKLEEQFTQMEAAQKELQMKAIEIEDLQNVLEKSHEEVNKKKHELEESTQKLKKVQNFLFGFESQLQKGQKEKDELQFCLDAKVQNIAELEKQIEDLQAKNRNLEEQIALIEDMKQNLQGYEDICSIKTNEANLLRKSLNEWETKTEKLKKEKTEIEHSFTEFKEEIKNKVDSLKSTLDTKENELALCYAKIKEQSSKISELEYTQEINEKKLLKEIEKLNMLRQQEQGQRAYEDANRVCNNCNNQRNFGFKDKISQRLNQSANPSSRNSNSNSDDSEMDVKMEALEQDSNDLETRQFIDIQAIIEENSRLKKEHKNKDQLLMKLNMEAAQHFKTSEQELLVIKESHVKLENEYGFIKSAIAVKDYEINKYKEDAKLLLLENAKIIEQLRESKSNEAKLQKEIELLKEERLGLMLKVDTLAKLENNPMASSDQKLREEIRKYKDRILQLKGEKEVVSEKLNQSLDKVEKLQKKIDELAKKSNMNGSDIKAHIEEVSKLQSELTKYKTEIKNLYDVLGQINQYISNYFEHPVKEVTSLSIQEIKYLISRTQDLIQSLAEKERNLQKREKEIQEKTFHHNLLARELNLIKKKYRLSYSGYLNESQNLEISTNKDLDEQNNLNEISSFSKTKKKTYVSDFALAEKNTLSQFIYNKKNHKTRTLIKETFNKENQNATNAILIEDDSPADPNDVDTSLEDQGSRKKVKIGK